MSGTDHAPSPLPGPSAGPAVIIGGGPAGCSAAAALGRLGFRPVLLESGKPGRDKACGDAFEPEALAILEAIGVGPADWAAAGGAPVSSALFRCTVPGGPSERLDTPGSWQIPRAALDQRLRDTVAPHADIRYGTRAVSVRSAADRWEVVVKELSGASSVIGASAVILAHGMSSQLSRQWNIDGDPDRAAAVRTYVAAPGLGPSLVEIAPETMPGYAWAFPLAGGRANVGFGVFAGSRANIREHARALLERHGWTAEAPWLGSGLAVWSGRGEVWHHPQGMVSCGDAAGLVEPLTGGGIAHALRSGRAAGNTVARFLRSGRNPATLGFHSAITGAYYRRRFAPEGGLKFWTGFLDRVAAGARRTWSRPYPLSIHERA